MIQRIQTVYLALAILTAVCALLFYSVSYWVEGTLVASIGSIRYWTDNQVLSDNLSSTWPLSIPLVLVILLNVMAIFLFRKRMRQLRIALFSTILLVGYVLALAFCTWFCKEQIAMLLDTTDLSMTFGISAFLPLVGIILNCMAIRGIRKDEALVRSLDRLR